MSGNINPRKQYITQDGYRFEIHGRVLTGSVESAMGILFPRRNNHVKNSSINDSKIPAVNPPKKPTGDPAKNPTGDPAKNPGGCPPKPKTLKPPVVGPPNTPRIPPASLPAKSDIYTAVSDDEEDTQTREALGQALDNVLDAVKPILLEIMQGGSPQVLAASLGNVLMDSIHKQKMICGGIMKYQNVPTIPQRVLSQVLAEISDSAPKNITSPVTRKVFVMSDRKHFPRLIHRTIADLHCTHVEINTTKEIVKFSFMKKAAPYYKLSEFSELLARDLGVSVERPSIKQLEFSMPVAMNSYKGLNHTFSIKPKKYTEDQSAKIQNTLCEAGMKISDCPDIVIGLDVQYTEPALLVIDVLRYFAATDSAR